MGDIITSETVENYEFSVRAMVLLHCAQSEFDEGRREFACELVDAAYDRLSARSAFLIEAEKAGLVE